MNLSTSADVRLVVAVYTETTTRYLTPANMKARGRQPEIRTSIIEGGHVIPTGPYCEIYFRPLREGANADETRRGWISQCRNMAVSPALAPAG